MFENLGMFHVGAAAALLLVLRYWLLRKLVVPHGCVALVYRNGRFRGRVSVGPHWYWRWGLDHKLVDMRQQLVTIPGQEVLAKDNVSLKVGVACRFVISDAEKALHTVQDHNAALYLAVQLALRDLVAGIPAEELIDARKTLSERLTEQVIADVASLGIRVDLAEVKDLMLPSDLKRAFADIVKARKESQATLERTRGEAATLRNLANAARLMDSHPGLLSLRVLDSVDRAGRVGGNTLVVGMPPDTTIASAARSGSK